MLDAKGTLALVALASATLLGSAATADTTAPLYAKMKQRFTSSTPGARTGWSLDGALEPLPAGQQVPPQRSTTVVFPAGTRIDPGAVAGCRASDEEVAARGLTACPRATRIGSGSAGVFLGQAGSVAARVTAFAGRQEAVLVVTTETGAVLRVLRAAVEKNRIVIPIPRVELPGGFEAAIFRFQLRVDAAGAHKRSLLRTPPRCPRSGRWTFTYLPRYDQPYGVQRSTSSMRCVARG